MCSSDWSSGPRTSCTPRMSSVAAIANTPSLNASSRPVDIGSGLLGLPPRVGRGGRLGGDRLSGGRLSGRWLSGSRLSGGRLPGRGGGLLDLVDGAVKGAFEFVQHEPEDVPAFLGRELGFDVVLKPLWHQIERKGQRDEEIRSEERRVGKECRSR